MKVLLDIKEALKSIRQKGQSPKIAYHVVTRTLCPYVRMQKRKLIIGFVLMISLSLISLPSPLLLRYLVDKVFLAKNIKLLHIILLLLLTIQLIKVKLSFFNTYVFNLMNREIMLSIKKDIFEKILSLPVSFFNDHQSGYIVSRIGEVDAMNIFFSSSSIRLIIGLFEIIFSLIILSQLSWKLTIISAMFLPVFYFAGRLNTRALRFTSKERMERTAFLSRHAQEAISGVDTVKMFTAEKKETERIYNYLKELKKIDIRNSIISSFSSELLSLVGAAGSLTVLWYSGFHIIKGSFSIGTYMAFAAYLINLYTPTFNLAIMGLSLQSGFVALNRITDILRLADESEINTRKINLSKMEKIEFDNVSFSYGQKEVLSNISFSINRNENVLLKGPNGAGKTTIMKLIMGLYKPTHGTINIDNQNINYISLNSLRNRISAVSQDIFLFNDTLLNNITYGNPQATIQEIEEAIKLSGLSNFVASLADGLETVIGESGKKLSGGEKQKVSIARAIIKDSDLIILDEFSSNLDVESASGIKHLLNGKFKDKICLITSHEDIELDSVTKIVVLNKGKIKEIINPE